MGSSRADEGVQSLVFWGEMILVVVTAVKPHTTHRAAQIELSLTLPAVANQVVHFGVRLVALHTHKSVSWALCTLWSHSTMETWNGVGETVS